MRETFLSRLLNVLTWNFRISIGDSFPFDGNSKGCEVAEHVATKVELNPNML